MEEEVKDEVKQRIFGYLDAIEASAGEAGSFVVEQTPLVAQEFLAWEFWGNVINACLWFILFVALAVPMFKLLLCAWREDTKDSNARKEDTPLTAVVFLVLIGVLFLPSLGTVVSFKRAVKTVVSPRVVLLEKVSELAGK